MKAVMPGAGTMIRMVMLVMSVTTRVGTARTTAALVVARNTSTSNSTEYNLLYLPTNATTLWPQDGKIACGEHLNVSLSMAPVNHTGPVVHTAHSSDDQIAAVVSVASNEQTELSIVISGGPRLGAVVINISREYSVDSIQVVECVLYEVIVIRSPSKARTHQILEYIAMAMGLSLLFFAGCHSTVYDIRKAWAWTLGALLFQLLLVPLVCLAYTELFDLSEEKKLAVMTTSYSPVGLVFIALAIAMSGDLGFTSVLVILNYLFANATIPLWNIQFNSLKTLGDTDLQTPFGTINTMFVVSSTLFMCGLTIHYKLPQVADGLRKVTAYICGLALVFSLFTALYGGADLCPSLAWKEITLCFFWPFILFGAAIITFATCKVAGSKLRTFGLFVCVKSFFIPAELLSSALPAPSDDLAAVSSYFFAMMTLIISVSFLLTYHCYLCIDEDGQSKMNPSTATDTDERKLVIGVDSSSHDPPPTYEEVTHGSRQRSADIMARPFAVDIAKASMVTASFGGPVIGI